MGRAVWCGYSEVTSAAKRSSSFSFIASLIKQLYFHLRMHIDAEQRSQAMPEWNPNTSADLLHDTTFVLSKH